MIQCIYIVTYNRLTHPLGAASLHKAPRPVPLPRLGHYIYTYIHTYAHVHTLRVYIYIYISLSLCIYIYIYMYTHIYVYIDRYIVRGSSPLCTSCVSGFLELPYSIVLLGAATVVIVALHFRTW